MSDKRIVRPVTAADMNALHVISEAYNRRTMRQTEEATIAEVQGVIDAGGVLTLEDGGGDHRGILLSGDALWRLESLMGNWPFDPEAESDDIPF